MTAFYISPTPFDTIPSRSSLRDTICLLNVINDYDATENESARGFSIFSADNREKAYAVRQYRFGGPSVDEYMKSKPDLTSRQDALRSLTPTFDDKGFQKVFYNGGVFGESVQFYAQADNVSAFISTQVQDDEYSKVSLMKTEGVLGSVEAVREYAQEGDDPSLVSIELKNLSVHATARRRGIGKALTEAVQEYARHQVSLVEKQESRRCSGTVHLAVESGNKGAIQLYKETGFVCPNNLVEGDELCNLRWSTSGEESVI